MRAKIGIHIKYPDEYGAPALYWSERKRLGVPEETNGYSCQYRHIAGHVDPDVWMKKARTISNNRFLYFNSEKVPSWDYIQNLDFDSALNLLDRQIKRQQRREQVDKLLHLFAPVLRFLKH